MLFRRNPRMNADQLEARIRELLNRSDIDRIPGTDAAVYNSIGDLCKEAGHRDRALSYYGDSIDAYLKAERWDSAAAMCRKVLRIAPGAVRTRCTLAWLAIGKGLTSEAARMIHDYADAAVDAGRDHLAVAQLKRMGDAAREVPIREAIAETLLQLGADRAADHFFGLVLKDKAAAPRATNDDLLWATVRHAALLGPTQLAN